MARQNFSKQVRTALAHRVGLRCSNPECRVLTSGPAIEPDRSINIGDAAHITAASPGGPRYDQSLTREQRRSIENAIWLCAKCARLIDRDTRHFTASLLRHWKSNAEDEARTGISIGTPYRSIAADEVLQELTIGEVVALKELSEEFRCHVDTDVKVQAGEGWFRLDAAVVHGDDLVAINIRENTGNGVAFFQIEHLLDIYSKHKLARFRKCIPLFVIVTQGTRDQDDEIRLKLKQLISASSLDAQFRMYRLDELRAKHRI